MEFVAAINPNYRFAIMDSNLSSRLDKIKTALLEWAGELPSSINHAYSLVTPGGPVSFHVKDLNSWLTGLESWQPPLNTMEASQDMLSQAIDLASTSLLEPGARRAILLITPNPEGDEILIMQDLAEKARQLDVHVFVWAIIPADDGPSSGLLALQALADQTGGSLVRFSGIEVLPSPEETLGDIQTSYRLAYTSEVRTSGTHTLSVQVKTDTDDINLPELKFDMEIEAPNPILVSPPSQILRQYPSGGDYDPARLEPDSQSMEIIIEFPDGHQRALTSTSLLVDGEVVDTNTSIPFDKFTWNLTSYTSNRELDVQVQVVDSLGLEKTSISIPVSVVVTEAPSAMEIFYLQNKQWIILGVGVAAGLLLIWRIFKLSKILKAKKKAQRNKKAPLPLKEELSSSTRGKLKEVPARLEPIQDNRSSDKQTSIPISAKEVRIGSDPAQSHFVLDDASVADFHAMLRWNGETFFVIDMGSAAGSWVNYEQMDEQPRQLMNGDILHFGNFAYQFKLTNPPKTPEPKIVLLDENGKGEL